MVYYDSTMSLDHLSLNTKVIVTLNGRDWEPAEIASVDYKLQAHDLELVPGGNSNINDNVPYRVKLCNSGQVHPVVYKYNLRTFTGTNIVRCRVDASLLSSSSIPQEEYADLFLLAVQLRNLQAVVWLQEKVKSMKQFDKMELLTKAIHFEQASMVPAFEEKTEEDAKVTELSQLLEWLKNNYEVRYEDYTDNLQRTPEHVAALRGDLVLLRNVLFKKDEPPNPLDIFDTAPFMYAARKGHVNLLDMYIQAIVNGTQKWKEEDLDQKNQQLQSCWDLAKNEETTSALTNLRQAVRGETMIPRLTPEEYNERMLKKENAFLEKIMTGTMTGATVNELEAMMKEAQGSSKSFISANSKLKETNDMLKKDFWVLGESEAWQKRGQDNMLIQLTASNRFEILDWMEHRFSLDQLRTGLLSAAYCDSLQSFEVLVARVGISKYLRDGTPIAEAAARGLSIDTIHYLIGEMTFLAPLYVSGLPSARRMMMDFCTTTRDGRINNVMMDTEICNMDPENRTELVKYVDSCMRLHQDTKDFHLEKYQPYLDATVNYIRAMGPEGGLPIPESLVNYFVNERHCDLLSSTKGALEEYDNTPWFRGAYGKALDARILKQRTDIACQVQPLVRGILARQRVLKDHADFGSWTKVILKINELKRSPSHKTFGKTWAELKLEYNYVAQSNEFDIYEEEALGAQSHDNEDDIDGELEERDGTLELTEDMIGGSPGEAITANILLTSEALKWLRAQKDQKYRELFHKRIDQLAKGMESYCLSKRLKGSKHGALETKLDKGQRIIWTQRGNDRMIWFICKHDKISRCCELIDKSYDRVIRNEDHEQFGFKLKNQQENDGDEPEMLANPIANVPLKIHAVEVDDLARLLVDTDWTPPLRLTPNEEDIVTREGTVLLLGRSGTGKTLCVCNRMARDRLIHGNKLRQLFVSRTSRLCEYVEALQKRAGEDLSTVAMRRVDDFVEELSRDVDPEKRWSRRHYVTYERFCSDIWPQIKGTEKELDALHVWTQVRSFIKGSYEATSRQNPLTAHQYIDFKTFGKDRCRLDRDQRLRAYAIFEGYQRILDKNGWWDEVDRARYVYAALHKKFEEEGIMQPLYDRIYVDEIQDITQSEITLLFLATGNNCDAMFFAGDTAQTVSQGVDFRFEEIRQIVFEISNQKKKLERPEKLSRNFRSHNGILSVSNLVLNKLHSAFPAAASKLPPDTGLVLGPRPGLLTMKYDEIANIIKKNTRLRILVRDECKSDILSKLGDASKTSCLGIREAKGLEFRDVIILDFFGRIGNKLHNKAWKNLLLGDTSKKMNFSSAYLDIPISMELELKLLYTAITRSCDRLFFIETKDSQAYDAWCRCLKQDDLAHQIKSDVLGENGVMTIDDWMIEGIEIASQVSDSASDEARDMLERAISNFQKANHKDYEQKCVANLKAVELLADAELFFQDDSLTVDSSNRKKAAECVAAYLDAGMVNEASRTCRRMCSSNGLSTFLVSLIQDLQGSGEDGKRK